MNIYEYLGLTINEKYRSNKNSVDITPSSGYTVIGNDYGTNICINSKGEVISLDPEQELPTRFINRDLETFLKFINIFTAYHMKVREADEEEQIQILDEMKEEFDKVDSRALDDEDNWWSVIVEQMEIGLM